MVKNSVASRENGWTLVELMIVVVIIGILAAVAVPIYQTNVKRAKAAEADAGLGTVRTALRVTFAEKSVYPIKANYTRVDSVGIDITSTDLNGTYFSVQDYKYQSLDGISYSIRVTGSGAQTGINRQIDQTGTLSNF